MAGRFVGLSDLEWRLFEDIFPPVPPKRGRGMPHAPFRQLLNTLLYILITGCRWCDVPRGPQWASQSAAQRCWQRWQADGTLAAMQARILAIAEERGMIRWEYGAVDGAFSPWQGWGGRRRTRGARQRDSHPQPYRRTRHALGELDHAGQLGNSNDLAAPAPWQRPAGEYASPTPPERP